MTRMNKLFATLSPVVARGCRGELHAAGASSRSQGRLAACALLALVAICVPAGCGSGEATARGGAAQFTCQLATIQEAANAQVEGLPVPSANDLSGHATFITQHLPIFEHEIGQLQNLTPAAAQATDFRALLNALEQFRALETQELSAAQQNDLARYNRVVYQARKLSYGSIPSLLVGSCAGRLKRALGG